MSTAAATRSLPERALETLRRAGNPFRNYFARNPDDEVCAVSRPRAVRPGTRAAAGRGRSVPLRPATHSEVVPVLGNKGSGKTHLLHSIKHGPEGTWQLLVTPGTYQQRHRFPGIPAVPADRHPAGRRQAEEHPAAGIRRRTAGAAACCATRLAQLTRDGAARPVPRAGPGPLGAPARPGRLAGPGTHAMADRQPVAAQPRCRSRPAASAALCDEARHRSEQALRAGVRAHRAAPRRTTRPA